MHSAAIPIQYAAYLLFTAEYTSPRSMTSYRFMVQGVCRHRFARKLPAAGVPPCGTPVATQGHMQPQRTQRAAAGVCHRSASLQPAPYPLPPLHCVSRATVPIYSTHSTQQRATVASAHTDAAGGTVSYYAHAVRVLPVDLSRLLLFFSRISLCMVSTLPKRIPACIAQPTRE